MKPPTNLAKSLDPLLMISLLLTAGCATPSKPQPTTVESQCSITWDKPDDSKVAGYQITVINQSKQTQKTVKFIPADTTTVSCKDTGADHAGLWDVTVQSCYDKSTCGLQLRPHTYTSQPSKKPDEAGLSGEKERKMKEPHIIRNSGHWLSRRNTTALPYFHE